MQVKEKKFEADMEQRTGSKFGKECVQAVYCHPAYLTYMQSIWCEKPGWMKHKLKSRFPGEISITSDMQMTLPLVKVKEVMKSFLMKVKEESGKASLKLIIQKSKIVASGPSLHGKYMGKQWKQWETLFFGALKSLQMVTAATKLKDTCSLVEKLWPT